MVPVGGFAGGFPLSRMSQFVAVWNLIVELNVPPVTPPPLQPASFALFTVIVGFTFCAEPDTGNAGVKLAVPLAREQLVPPAATAVSPPALTTVIAIGTTNTAVR